MSDAAPSVFDYDPATSSGSIIGALYALQDAEALFRGRMRDHLGIGSNDLGAIQYLARLENVGRDARPRDVTETLGVTSAATTILLTRLVRRGFVTRHPDPQDGRGQLLRLTAEVRSRMAAALGDSQAALALRLAAIGPREAKRVVDLLAVVTDSLNRGVPERAVVATAGS